MELRIEKKGPYVSFPLDKMGKSVVKFTGVQPEQLGRI